MTLDKVLRTFWDAIISNDKEGIESAYVQDEDTYVILEGPRYTTMGFKKIAHGWSDFIDSSIDLKSVEWVEGPFEEISEEMAWIAGIIDLTIFIQGKEITRRFRASFVFRLRDGEWKIRHEHVSAPMEDPYGVGDWLVKQAD